MLQVIDLKVEIAGKTTLERASFTINPGDKVGLVGKNGAGKTTLLRTLGGELAPKAGSILRKGAHGYLSQDPKIDKTIFTRNAIEQVLSGRGLDKVTANLEKVRHELELDPSEKNIKRFASALERFEQMDGYSAEAEVLTLLDGLGIARDRNKLALSNLSGGERRRVELARVAFSGSDILMLDEPTNHLDLDAKRWLMGFLEAYRGGLLIISHDLDLLDESINRVLHLHNAKITPYRGTYSQYKNASAKEAERQAKVAKFQRSEIKRLVSSADAMRGQSERRAKVAHALDLRAKRIEEEMEDLPEEESESNYQLPDPPPCGRTVLEVENISKSYGGPAIFDQVSFAVERGERLLIVGLNGAGKTSLLSILAQQIKPDSGSFTFDKRASVGYYAQEHEGITKGVSVLDHMRRTGDQSDGQLRKILGMMDLSGDIAFQDASTLSGGEKTKLSIAQLVAGQHNTLLLDEPTNNLDPPSLEAIGSVLSKWSGTMVIVSHDSRFVKKLFPQRVLYMPDGILDYWSDDLADIIEMA